MDYEIVEDEFSISGKSLKYSLNNGINIMTSIDKKDIEKYQKVLNDEIKLLLSQKIEGLKDIITFKNSDNDFNIVYENNMTKKYSLNRYTSKELLESLEKDIVDKLSSITLLYEDVNKNLNEILDDTFEMIGNKTKTLEKFIIINDKKEIGDEIINNYNVFKTPYIKDEVIFGYKTDIDEAGVTIFYDESSLDSNEIGLNISEIGFFPSASYRRFKI